MLDVYPEDKVPLLLEYLGNDHVTLCRLMECNKDLRRLIVEHMTRQNVWKKMRLAGWRYGREKDDSATTTTTTTTSYQQELDAYKHRVTLDNSAKRVVNTLANYLRDNVREWNQPLDLSFWKQVRSKLSTNDEWQLQWSRLLSMRNMVHDCLHRIAVAGLDDHTDNLETQLRGFVAARCLVGVNLLECLHEWKEIYDRTNGEQNGDDAAATAVANDKTDSQVEGYALLAVQVQLTLPELLQEGEILHREQVRRTLDSIAETCRPRVTAVHCTLDQIQVVNEILFEEMGFQGNSENYYDYRNSLLHWVLKNRKGIPISLGVVYALICQRLGIKVDFIGLPGHFVLGFVSQGHRHYLDVFQQGRLLSEQDCRRIVASYGQFAWNETFLLPLSPRDVMTRTLRNLNYCHSRGQSKPFQDIASFQERIVQLMHQQPQIAVALLETAPRSLGFTVNEEMLRLYHLIA